MSNINKATRETVVVDGVFDSKDEHVIFECTNGDCPHKKCLIIRRFRADEKFNGWAMNQEINITTGFTCTIDGQKTHVFRVISMDKKNEDKE